jgi:hypothetical protein
MYLLNLLIGCKMKHFGAVVFLCVIIIFDLIWTLVAIYLAGCFGTVKSKGYIGTYI